MLAEIDEQLRSGGTIGLCARPLILRMPRWRALCCLFIASIPSCVSIILMPNAFGTARRLEKHSAWRCGNHLNLLEAVQDFASLSRRELQTLAKAAGIRANQKSVDIIAQLEAQDVPISSASSLPPPQEAKRKGASLTDSLENDAAASAFGDVNVDLIERRLPTLLTPARCEAGLWQPLHLIGEDDVEITCLVRNTGDNLVDCLDVPPLHLFGALRLDLRPPMPLSAVQVAHCAAFTSTVLGLMGFEDASLFPPPAQILSADGSFRSTDPQASHAVSAAMLFLPGDGSGDLDALRDPSRWEAHEVGETGVDMAAPAMKDAFPVDATGRPLLLIEHKAPVWIPYIPMAKLTRGPEAQAKVTPSPRRLTAPGALDPSRLLLANPKNELHEKASKYRRSHPTYTVEQLGEQLWKSTVVLGDGDPSFEGDAAPRKKVSEMSAARRALDWVEEHWSMPPPANASAAQGSEAPGPAHDDLAAASASREMKPEDGADDGEGSDANLISSVGRFAARLGGYVTTQVEERGHQLFVAHLTLESMCDEARQAGPPTLLPDEHPVVCGEPARSKLLAQRNAARTALKEWCSWSGWSEATFAKTTSTSTSTGRRLYVVPLRAAQWRGASCGVVVARMIAHSTEVVALRANLTKILPKESVPPLATLRRATTPRQINGYQSDHETAVWVGNAVRGLCNKIASVIALNQRPREAKAIQDTRRHNLWMSHSHLANCVRSQGWDKALFLLAWPGTNGVTSSEASVETLSECLDSVMGEVFLRSMASKGMDAAMEDAWSLFDATVLSRYSLKGDDGQPLPGWQDVVGVVRGRLRASRLEPGRVWAKHLWAHRPHVSRPSEPALIAAAAAREWEGQSLELIGDGVLRVLQTLHLVWALPDVESSRQRRARTAVERNAFLARRLVRTTIGTDRSGLSAKLRSEQAQVLSHMGAKEPSRSSSDGFEEDLCAEGRGRSILADVLEALVGAVALEDEHGLEMANQTFAHIVLPPPEALALVLNPLRTLQ